jgi:hypothetical protein
MTVVYNVVDLYSGLVVGSFDNYFDARDFTKARGDLAIDLVEVDDEGFEVDDPDDDYDSDFGYDPYMGCYTYDC